MICSFDIAMPPGVESSSEEVSNAGPQPPWNSIPKFVPGTTNVQEYVQKLRFLAQLWPREHLEQLAPRAALLVEGSAFKKVSKLDPEKLRVKSISGIALLVDAIGGSWGSTELEERYEFFEKSLYGTIQRSDESHDSYLARFEANFTELISRETKLEEVQAYVLLRQSTLPPEDKKKILLEHSGTLEYKPVVKSFRLLGSKFFHEFQSGRTSNKTKVYDINMVEPSGLENPASSSDQWSERAFHAISDDGETGELEPEFIEAMIAQEDVDAMTVSAFETELEEFMQETPEMYDAMVTYLEARTRLQEKRKTRGFWPVKGGGRFSKSKGRGKGKKGKESLLSRIAKSRCRLCNELGHWKAECPRRMEAQSHDSANVAVAVGPFETCLEPTQDASFAEVSELEPDEDSQRSESNVVIENAFVSFSKGRDNSLAFRMHRFVALHKDKADNHDFHNPKKQVDKQATSPYLIKPVSQCHVTDRRANEKPASAFPMFRFERIAPRKVEDSNEGAFVACDHFGTHAILDTGASRCIIGEKTLSTLKSQLPDFVIDKLKKTKSQVKFRFGNNQFLTSEYRIHFPLQRESSKPLWLAVEVVPGATPFLFSKRAFKALGGVLNTVRDSCILQKMSTREIKLAVGPTDLYLLDIAALCHPCPDHETSFHKEDHHAYVGEVNHQGESDDKSCLKTYIGSLKSSVSHNNMSNTTAACVDAKCPSKRDLCVHRFVKHAGFRRFPQVHCRGHDSAVDAAVTSHGESVGTTQHRDRDQCLGESRDQSTVEPSDDRVAESEKSSGKFDARTSREICPSACACWHDGLASSDDFKSKPCGDHCRDSSHTGKLDCSQCGLDTCRSRGGEFSDRSRLHPRGDHGSSQCGKRYWTDNIKDKSPCESGLSSDRCTGNIDATGVGSKNHHMGQEAQGKILCAGHDVGSGILDLEPSKIQLASSGSTGLRSFRSDVSDSQQLNDPTRDNSDLQSVRHKLQNNPKFVHRLKKIDKSIQASINKAEEVLDQSFVKNARCESTVRPVFLLEIYAGEHSPLTDAVMKAGLSAIRFTRADGDLSSISGRQKLWNIIEKYQPEHIWMAPECGPWGGWNRLNMFKSPAMFESIQQKQFEQMPHVRLCSRICQYQVQLHRHFHLEQPLGSNMIHLPEFEPISKVTLRAVFDMCQFGLRIPNSNRYIRKSSQLCTTSLEVFQSLDHVKCKGQHEHQRIEGSLNIHGRFRKVSQFCATYCRGFAERIARLICNRSHTFVGSKSDAFVNHDQEDERPNKRFRFSHDPHKRFRSNQWSPNNEIIDLDPDPPLGNTSYSPSRVDVGVNEGLPIGTPAPSQAEIANGPPEIVVSGSNGASEADKAASWDMIFNLAQQTAPRVGNLKVDVSSDLFAEFQKMIPDMCIENLFVCRGTERLQVPVGAPVSHQFPLRKTVSIHRQTGDIHQTDIENWHSMTRSQRIRAHVPSKLMITAFGTKQETSSVRLPESRPDVSPEEEPPSTQRADPRSFNVSQRSLGEVPEGWAPPPIPLHGPLFRNLTAQEKQDLVKLHKNLGHPDPQKLAQHLEALGAQPHIVAASREFVCDACVESSHTKHQRPAQIHDAREFNELVGIDGFYWTGQKGFQTNAFHCIDEASLFHLGKCLTIDI